MNQRGSLYVQKERIEQTSNYRSSNLLYYYVSWLWYFGNDGGCMSERKFLRPQDGGCWFCSHDQCDSFDREFDTALHLECLKVALGEGSEEAEIMSYLLEPKP